MDPTTARAGHGERLWQVDALRGLMLVLMTLTHLPTRVASAAGQPFGYVSAAEGFVLLSAFTAGLVYAGRQHREGTEVMRGALLKRVAQIYLCQAALLLFLFSVVALIGLAARQDAVQDLMSFYLRNPVPALLGSMLLVYNPPLLDILPMYILFLLASPLLMVHGRTHGWGAILAVSTALWLAAQFGLGGHLYEAVVAATGLPIPLRQTGAFEILAWQFLWVLGLWLGASRVWDPAVLPTSFPRGLVAAAAVYAGTTLVWRHAVGQTPFPDHADLNLLFDKWQLAPLRLLNVFALLVLAIRFAPWLSRRLPRLRPLEILGAASLPVFCAHLVLALLCLALIGPARAGRPWPVDAAILAASFAVLAAVAWVSTRGARPGAPASVSARVAAWRRAGAARWRPSRSRNRPG